MPYEQAWPLIQAGIFSLDKNDDPKPSTHNGKPRLTRVFIARIPPEGIADFRAYEDAVLPLLPAHNGRLERRLRNHDGTMEVHIVTFASDADLQNYRNDPRRTAQAALLKRSSAVFESVPMANVA